MPFSMLVALLRRGRPLLSTAIFVMLTTSSTTSIMLTGFFWMASGPEASSFSDLAISMMFVTRSRRRAAQPPIMLRCRFCAADASFAIEPLKPMMPCSGLRSSWPSTAVICFCRAWIAFIAPTSVRSCPMPVIVRRSSSLSWTMSVNSIFTGRWSSASRLSTTSTAPELSPLRQQPRAVRSTAQLPSSTRSKTLAPTACASEMPESRARCSFQAATTPSCVIVRIGALALRKMRLMSSLPASMVRCIPSHNDASSSQFRTTTSTAAWITLTSTSPMV
mmetsp:Transcript_36772/g.105907  ORF Transcript_36772/g.105907 Transcript_36772/m.105907 type:complete len:277 (+) Transcript_36772:958-1788(+)